MKHSRRILVIALVLFCVALWAPVAGAQAQEEAKVKVNINTATAEELMVLKYVGEALSQRIVEYREEHGAFESPEDIVKVPGVGQRVYEENKDIITVE
jgi:competence protein ComEA